MNSPIIVASTLLLLCAAAGCTESNKAEDKNNREPVKAAPVAPPVASEPAPSAAAAPAPSEKPAVVAYELPAESQKIFTQRCALCHGKAGKGDGAGGRGMKPPPRDWTDPAWGASVTDDHIATAIVKGGAGVGKSATMPPNPDLEGSFKKPVVDGLVHMVRSFAAPATAASAGAAAASSATHP
jgi:mono/diheme cytochrome c family protein